MSEKKPIIDQIKSTIANKEQIREQILQNIHITKKIVETQAKQLFEQTKQSKFFNEKVIPLVESEQADKAINLLNSKLNLKGTTVMKKLEKLRKEIVDLKIEKAKPAKQVEKKEEAS